MGTLHLDVLEVINKIANSLLVLTEVVTNIFGIQLTTLRKKPDKTPPLLNLLENRGSYKSHNLQ